MTTVFDLAHAYVDKLAALDPNLATALGIPGHEREMTDYSPDGQAAVAALNRRTATKLGSTPVESEQDRIARAVMLERLAVYADLFEAGEHFSDLNNIASPLQDVRQVFDQMAKETPEDWADVAVRLRLVPLGLAGYRTTLETGMRRGATASKRQTLEGVRQAETWAGLVEGQAGFFDMLLEGSRKEEGGRGGRRDLEEGVRAAKEGYAAMARWLREVYLPAAKEREGCGEERYQMRNRVFSGCSLDAKGTYQWGWDELHRVEREMRETAEQVLPGASVAEAKDFLESDDSRAVAGAEAYQRWLQELHDEALAAMHGTHFDIPEQVRRIEVMIPPPGGALIPYYTGPSEDFSRAGRTWWPIGERTRFPVWREVSIAYHEGVPGHHLQIGATMCLGDQLSRYQRVLCFVSGHGEGWALYSERLMGELGFLERPDYYLGMLSAQAMRCVRVIIDIGAHLELPIPAGESFHPGEMWDHDLMLEFAVARAHQPREFLESEIVRYLGWPAQAISYKVGERKWLEAREAARRRMGASFDLKTFHTEALGLGPMGLEMLERELGGG